MDSQSIQRESNLYLARVTLAEWHFRSANGLDDSIRGLNCLVRRFERAPILKERSSKTLYFQNAGLQSLGGCNFRTSCKLDAKRSRYHQGRLLII